MDARTGRCVSTLFFEVAITKVAFVNGGEGRRRQGRARVVEPVEPYSLLVADRVGRVFKYELVRRRPAVTTRTRRRTTDATLSMVVRPGLITDAGHAPIADPGARLWLAREPLEGRPVDDVLWTARRSEEKVRNAAAAAGETAEDARLIGAAVRGDERGATRLEEALQVVGREGHAARGVDEHGSGRSAPQAGAEHGSMTALMSEEV